MTKPEIDRTYALLRLMEPYTAPVPHDAWGRPLMQAGDGHGAWSCNNYACTDHPASLYGRTSCASTWASAMRCRCGSRSSA
jgi:hypothetical protein